MNRGQNLTEFVTAAVVMIGRLGVVGVVAVDDHIHQNEPGWKCGSRVDDTPLTARQGTMLITMMTMTTMENHHRYYHLKIVGKSANQKPRIDSAQKRNPAPKIALEKTRTG
jgi:hypothetical protein